MQITSKTGSNECSNLLSSLFLQIQSELENNINLIGLIDLIFAKAKYSIFLNASEAQINDEILDMPQGYESKVGERGLKLSGGQKQRIAIARAMLREAPIIILDEATASVDSTTEKQKQQAIISLCGNHTVIAIAHRLSTIKNADQILLIEDGKIVERGTHSELIALGGKYKKLHDQNT